MPTDRTKRLKDARERMRWTPIKRGEIYCSPGCGGGSVTGCTLSAFNAATAAARALADGLGEGWEPNVWENLGWHWEVTAGDVAIHQYQRANGDARYRASVHNNYWSESRPSPRAALRETLRLVQATIEWLRVPEARLLKTLGGR